MSHLSQEKIDYIKNHPHLTNKELSEILLCDRHTVGKYKAKFGQAFSQTHDFSKYNQYIIDNYYKKTATSLAKEIGCSKSYVIKVWNQNCNKDKTKRHYYSDFSYFNKIDNPTKAYILGFICSDGCVYKRDNHEGLLSIVVAKGDIQILQDIKKELHSENPISVSDNSASFVIVSQVMFDDLNNLGVRPRKTYNLDLLEIVSHIPKKFICDFIHGYFDGDGSISLKDIPSSCSVSIALPESSVSPMLQILSQFNIEGVYIKDKRLEKYTIPFGNVCFVNCINKYCFLKFLLKHDTIKLTRKFQIIQKFFVMVEENITNRSENKIAVEKWGEMLETLR